MIDSKTGVVLDSMGKQIKEAKKVEYSDIKGNAAEKDIQLLIEMGIIEDENTKYNPNGEMLQKDFIKMLVRAMEPYMFVYNTYTDSSSDEYEKYYKIAIERKIISEKEKQPNSQISKQITANACESIKCWICWRLKQHLLSPIQGCKACWKSIQRLRCNCIRAWNGNCRKRILQPIKACIEGRSCYNACKLPQG
jgi:hypothetical protein